MLRTILTDIKTGISLHTNQGLTSEPILIVGTFGEQHGTYAAVTRTGAGTTTIIAAHGSDAIVLTDLILTSDKVQSATITINITDGVNTVVVIGAEVTDAPCNIAIPFAGRWMSWQGARVDMVTVNAVSATLALGYYRVPEDKALPFAAWNALR